ncbi:hypothetical protein L1887_55346 [Cichorium endivia]|nr:hypothetical protein L1887_55346 [Cichorium endivia]
MRRTACGKLSSRVERKFRTEKEASCGVTRWGNFMAMTLWKEPRLGTNRTLHLLPTNHHLNHVAHASFDVHMCTSLDSGSQTEKLPRVSHTIPSPPLMTWVVGADVAVCIESHTPHPHPEAPASVVSSFDHFQKVFSSGPHFHPEKLQSAPASSSSGAQQGVNMDGREAAEDIHLLPERFWKTPALAFSPEEMDAVMTKDLRNAHSRLLCTVDCNRLVGEALQPAPESVELRRGAGVRFGFPGASAGGADHFGDAEGHFVCAGAGAAVFAATVAALAPELAADVADALVARERLHCRPLPVVQGMQHRRAMGAVIARKEYVPRTTLLVPTRLAPCLGIVAPITRLRIRI